MPKLVMVPSLEVVLCASKMLDFPPTEENVSVNFLGEGIASILGGVGIGGDLV
jgi:hypothetical protein